MGDQEPVPTGRDAVQPLHADHRGDRLGPRNGESRLADETRTKSPQRSDGKAQVRDLIEIR